MKIRPEGTTDRRRKADVTAEKITNEVVCHRVWKHGTWHRFRAALQRLPADVLEALDATLVDRHDTIVRLVVERDTPKPKKRRTK